VQGRLAIAGKGYHIRALARLGHALQLLFQGRCNILAPIKAFMATTVGIPATLAVYAVEGTYLRMQG
jgi:hypothetical protein